MKKQAKFALSKWYMDCVSEAGDVFIGYAASLHWRGLAINYSSILQHRNREATTVNTSLKKISPPTLTERSLSWSSPHLGIHGTWIAQAAPIQRTLFESDAGGIEWHCVQPRSQATICIGNAEIAGLGYVEHIAISIPPWQLPIEELRWGRFLSNHDALVWIDWRGAEPLTLVVHNGIEIPKARVTDQEIACPQGRMILTFAETQLLREGQLMKTALAMIPGVKKLLPLRSLQTYECKWRSQGLLKEPATSLREGWAIHEIVRFG